MPLLLSLLPGQSGSLTLPLFGGRLPPPSPYTSSLARKMGTLNYSFAHISSSPFAQAIFTASSTFQKAYSRLPLLLSPSRPVPWPANFAATVTPETFHHKTCATDGQSEVSPQVAREIGLLPQTVTPKRPGLYSPWQFRAFLPTTANEGTLLACQRREVFRTQSVEFG